MRTLIILFLLNLSFSSVAQPVQIVDVQLLKTSQQNMRLVFDLSAPVTHNVFTLTSPYRLVIDFKNVVLGEKKLAFDNQTLVTDIRSAARNKGLRLVLELSAPIHSKSFLQKPTGKFGHRLIVEINTLTGNDSTSTGSLVTTLPNATTSSFSPPQLVSSAFQSLLNLSSSPTSSPPPDSVNDIVIAIDAGHGGIDSGTVGQGGTLEKEVDLEIAKELATLITEDTGMRPVLIRDNDYFLELRRRVELAREAHADLFISLHADAYPSSNRVHGSSVYMLSSSGASSEAAQWLAERENSADLAGGIKLSDKDELLASVLIDLLQTGTLQASAQVGSSVLKSLTNIGKNHFNYVQQANFMVLRSREIPSILIETGFLSNPEDEKKLNDPAYRLNIAQAILEGVQEYFAAHPPLNKTLANR